MKKIILTALSLALLVAPTSGHAQAPRIQVSAPTPSAPPLEIHLVKLGLSDVWQVGSRQWLKWKYPVARVTPTPTWPETAVLQVVLEKLDTPNHRQAILKVSPAASTRRMVFTVPKLEPGEYRLEIMVSDNGQVLAVGDDTRLITVKR